MFYVLFILSAIAVAVVVFFLFYFGWKFLRESIKMPKEGRIQAITRFGKLYKFVMSVQGYRLNNPYRKKYFDSSKEPWELIKIEDYDKDKDEKDKYKQSFGERWNLYFFPWPLFKTHRYPFSYTKIRKRGATKESDMIIWSKEEDTEVVVSRSGESDFVYFRAEYPTITANVRSKGELASIVTFTSHALETTNPFRMVFRIDDWFGMTTSTIGGAIRDIVSSHTIEGLNQMKSEVVDDPDTKTFTESMRVINEGKPNVKDGIRELWGVKLTKSVFRDFKPGDADADRLMDSFIEPKIAEQVGVAKVITAENDAKVTTLTATAEATAYATNQAAIVEWRKKYLVDTGLAKVDANGNIKSLVPDANTRVSAEALKALSNVTGTVVLGGDFLNTLGIQPTKGGTS